MHPATRKQIFAYLVLVAAVAWGKMIGNDMSITFILLILLPIRLMADIREANQMFPYKLEFNGSMFRNQWLIWWLIYGLWCAGGYMAKLGY